MLALEISSLADELTVKGPKHQPRVLPDISAKLARRECLQTGEVVPEDQRYRRGLSPAAYQRTRNKIKAREVTEDELIYAGLLAPASAGGRQVEPDALDQYIATKHQRTDADAQAEAAHFKEKSNELSTKKLAKKKPKNHNP